ncbi:MAG: hypothetical protein HGA90_02245 [Alphaproteobacteria bacterium]|nr:hypothetical protein [Alphaproteobacteria bacterium]
MTLFIVYFLPYEAALAFVLRRVFGLAWLPALLGAFGLCFLIPPLWLPLLEGYPDIGGAACITFALGLLLGRSKNWRGALAVGALLALAILLRRHFAYAALALLVAAGSFSLFSDVLKTEKELRLKALRRFLLLGGFCGLTILGLLSFIAPVFLYDALGTNYTALYRSYKTPLEDFLLFAASSFGLFLLLAALAGYGLAAHAFPAARRALIFVAATTFLWLLLWCVGPRQAGHHYLLHFMPLFVAIGLAGLFLALRSSPANRCGARVLALLLLANSCWTLGIAPEGVAPNFKGPARLWSAPRPPAQRTDYDELVALADYLASTTKSTDKILILGSSFVFNQDLMRAAFMDALDNPAPINFFLGAPEVDSEQGPPFDAFAAATIYVVPEPAQYHLDPTGQKVVTAAAAQFPPPPERESLFQADSRVFSLEKDVKVRIWRRKVWTPLALHATLESLRKIAGGAQDWVTPSPPLRFSAGTDAENKTNIMALFDGSHRKMSLFFGAALPPGSYRLGLDAMNEPACQNLRFILVALTPDGKEIKRESFIPVLLPGSVFHPFVLPKNEASSFLQLDVHVDPFAPCSLALQQLRLEKIPD